MVAPGKERLHIFIRQRPRAEIALRQHEFRRLDRIIRAYFDTTTGAKNASPSYLRIAETLALEASNILFISDVGMELDAAHGAGMQTALCVREGTTDPVGIEHRVIHSFDDISADS